MNILRCVSFALRQVAYRLNRSLGLVFVLSCLVPGLAMGVAYTDNGNGTVTDSGTGLTWMRCSMGQTWTGSTCSGTANTYTWDQANALTGTVSFAGNSDWRLPNIRELLTIVDRSRLIPAIDTNAFPNTSTASEYWSSTAHAMDSSLAWYGGFYSGITHGGSKGSTHVVRLVRAGQSSSALLNLARPTTDYVDHGDGTVTHTLTGLMWHRCAKGQTWTGSTCSGSAAGGLWGNAMSMYSYSFAGYTDWRLPTYDELETLVDYTTSNPSLNSTIFPSTPSYYFWSSSLNANNSGTPWGVYFTDGNTSSYYGQNYGYFDARFVRSGQSNGSATTTTTSTTTTAPTTTTTSPTTTTTTSSVTTTTQAGGNYGRLNDNGNGTVTDSGTALTWMRCSVGQTWTGSTCSGTAGTYTWDQAAALTGTTSFGSQSDWRLPNILELQSIVDRTRSNPAIDPTAFPGTPSSNVWSSTPSAANSANAWYVNFGSSTIDGSAYLSPKTNTFAVRMVRGGQSSVLSSLARPDSAFVDNGDGTVTHTATGLMWKKCIEASNWDGTTCPAVGPAGGAANMTWDTAKLLTVTFAGKSDWRLATEDELLTIVDYTRYSPAINTTVFPNSLPFSFIYSSTPKVGTTSTGWGLYFERGDSYSTSGGFQVRLVRGGTGAASSTTTSAPTTTSTAGSTTSTTTVGSTTTTTLAGSNGAGTSDVVTLNFASGWNLVGNSLSGVLDVAATFGDSNKVSTVWKWIVSKLGWAFYTPSLGDGGAAYASGKGYDFLTSVNGGEGFWVNAKSAFSVQLPSGSSVASTSFQNMASGWNLIAVGDSPTPSAFNKTLSVTTPAAGEIPLNVTTLWAWDAGLSNWYFYAPSLEKNGGLGAYIQSKNYLDFGTKTLDQSVGFWVNKP